jgi:hypothetical protein
MIYCEECGAPLDQQGSEEELQIRTCQGETHRITSYEDWWEQIGYLIPAGHGYTARYARTAFAAGMLVGKLNAKCNERSPF